LERDSIPGLLSSSYSHLTIVIETPNCQIFDILSQGDKPFEDRIAFLKKTFGPGGAYELQEVVVLDHGLAKSSQHVIDKLKEIESLGGEGRMLRKPESYVILLDRFTSFERLVIVCTRGCARTPFSRSK
jgi:hypothetical protein